MDRFAAKELQVRDALAQFETLAGGDELLVGQVMTCGPQCISMETSALEVVRIFHGQGFRHLPVLNADESLAGLISDADVIRCFGLGEPPSKEALAAIPASQLMCTEVLTVNPATPLSVAVELMIDHGIGCLPVVANGRLVGIITGTDLHVVLRIVLKTVRLSGLFPETASFKGRT